jgi:hypothetical protein
VAAAPVDWLPIIWGTAGGKCTRQTQEGVSGEKCSAAKLGDGGNGVWEKKREE